MEGLDQTQRACIVSEALTRLRARGIYPKLAVIALHERYIKGEINFEELRASMHVRALTILTRGKKLVENQLVLTAA